LSTALSTTAALLGIIAAGLITHADK
jgi:hypothetical protein